MESIISEVASRLHGILTDLAEGRDVPPSRSLRVEGLLEAAVLTGAASEAELDALLAVCFQACMNRPLSSDLGENWREFHPFPQLPLWMARAPVYPSTAD